MRKYQLPIGNKILKKTKPYNKLNPLQKEVYDLCADPINGLLFFAENCIFVNKNGLTHYEPFPYQRELLFDYVNYQKCLALDGRQLGKTTTSAIYILWFATFNEYKQILITSQDERSANEILTTIKLMYENCPNFLKQGCLKINESELWFENKSRIFSRATTSKAARGLSPALIYCDEFALVGNQDSAEKALYKQQEFFASITPALASSNGKLFITSTPISETDLYYQLWNGATNKTDDKGLDLPRDYILKINGELYRDFHKFSSEEEAENYATKMREETGDEIEVVSKAPPGNNGFQSHFATWRELPWRTEKWASEERKINGEARFRREHECIDGETLITIMDDRGVVFTAPIEKIYNLHNNQK